MPEREIWSSPVSGCAGALAGIARSSGVVWGIRPISARAPVIEAAERRLTGRGFTADVQPERLRIYLEDRPRPSQNQCLRTSPSASCPSLLAASCRSGIEGAFATPG